MKATLTMRESQEELPRPRTARPPVRAHRMALYPRHAEATRTKLDQLAGVEAIVAYGGIVGRAENRALVKVLKLPVVPVARVEFDDYDLICMVDTQPEQGNHSLPARHFPDVVIDHHPELTVTSLTFSLTLGTIDDARYR